jgi:hypothetical protein
VSPKFLEDILTETVKVKFGSGTELSYTKDVNKSTVDKFEYIPEVGVSDNLISTLGFYILTRKNGTTYKFDNKGLLIQISDIKGNYVTIKNTWGHNNN